jgi:uridine kinase
MTRWVPQKKDVLASIAEEFLHNYGRGRTLLAIDGAETAATGRFADDLAAALRQSGSTVFRASLGDFHLPRAERAVIRDSVGNDTGVTDPAQLAYRSSYDYAALKRVLVEPFRMGGSTGFVPAFFDQARDAAVEPTWLTGPADAVLLIDGEFANRPELRGLWNYSIYLDDPNVDARGAQELYRAESAPRTTATAIVDNTFPDTPRRRFADSC